MRHSARDTVAFQSDIEADPSQAVDQTQQAAAASLFSKDDALTLGPSGNDLSSMQADGTGTTPAGGKDALRGVLGHVGRVTRLRAREWLEAMAITGNVSEACRISGLPSTSAYRLREKDAGFRALWLEAELIAADLLHAEARRRAYDGVDKPVYQQGVKVGVIREYSDKLLEVLLKAHKPDMFKDRKEVAHTGAVVHFHIEGVERAPIDATNAQPGPITIEEE